MGVSNLKYNDKIEENQNNDNNSEEINHFVVSNLGYFMIVGVLNVLFFGALSVYSIISVSSLIVEFISKEDFASATYLLVIYCLLPIVFALAGLYLILKYLNSKIVVNGNNIIYTNYLKKPKAFTLDSITTVKMHTHLSDVDLNQRLVLYSKDEKLASLNAKQKGYVEFLYMLRQQENIEFVKKVK